jgi:two-component system, LytTR family, response regulator
MINCIAVDDEPLALSLLTDNISKVGFLDLKASCDNALAANKILHEQDIDLVFADIQMPGLTGLQFIRSMAKKPSVIIVSAYKQYALDGFDLNVVDYLVKPVSLERFIKACNKAKELIELKSVKNAPDILKEPVTANNADFTFLNTGHNLLKTVFSEVLYIEGLRDYVKIHFTDGRKPAIVRLTFKTIEEKWPGWFMRIHKSFIVNTKQISALNKSGVVVGQQELPLGDAYRQSVVKMVDGAR